MPSEKYILLPAFRQGEYKLFLVIEQLALNKECRPVRTRRVHQVNTRAMKGPAAVEYPRRTALVAAAVIVVPATVSASLPGHDDKINILPVTDIALYGPCLDTDSDALCVFGYLDYHRRPL